MNWELVVAVIALLVAVISFGLSIYFWRRSFRPIVTAAVKTHSGGNAALTYDLVVLNSGSIPAKNIRLRLVEPLSPSCFGSDATTENKENWLACFREESLVPVLQNGDRTSCSFGTTKNNDAGFWKYNSQIMVIITYDGWFGRTYREQQALKIVDSDSFTGFHWSR